MKSHIPARVQQIVQVLEDGHGSEILVMDVRKLTDAVDYFILCTGNSDPHLKALADELEERSKEVGDPPWHVEGYSNRRWILMDFVDVVVHLFRPEAREFYALERLWGDAVFTRIQNDGAETAVSSPAVEPSTQVPVFTRS